MLNNPLVSGLSTGRGSDSESDGPPHRKMPDVRKDDMSVRRTSVTELRTPLPFNQYLPNRSNHSGYMPTPLRKKMNDKDEGSRKSWSTATSPVGGDRPCRWVLQMTSCVGSRFIQRLHLENVILFWQANGAASAVNDLFGLSYCLKRCSWWRQKLLFHLIAVRDSRGNWVGAGHQELANISECACVCLALCILHSFLMHVLLCFSSIFFLFLYPHIMCDPPFQPSIPSHPWWLLCHVFGLLPDVTLTRFPVCVCVWMGDGIFQMKFLA